MTFVPPAYTKFLNEQIFQGNIQALATVQRPLAEHMAQYKPPLNQPFRVEPTPSGDLTLAFSVDDYECYLHSKEDPQAEARKWVSEVMGDPASAYVIFGFGLGYPLQVLRQIIPQRAKVLVFEQSIDVFWLALWTVDLRVLLSDPRFRYAIAMDVTSVRPMMYNMNFSSWDSLTAQLYEFNHLTMLFDEYYRDVSQYLKEYFESQQIEVNTEHFFDLTWTLNFLRNLPKVLEAAPVRHLFGRFENVPAVIVAAGPSLEKNIDQLAEFAVRGVIIATSPTLRALLQRGIRPNFVVIIDGDPANLNYFKDLPNDEVPLVFDATTYPFILQSYRGGGKHFVLFGADKKPVYNVLETHVDITQSIVNVGGSVANMGLNLAYQLGCNPIVFAGQDLALTNQVTHFSGYDNRRGVVDINDKNLIETEDIFGEKIYTQSILMAFREWFEWFITVHADRTYINATEGGIGIPGVPNRPLVEVMGDLPSIIDRSRFELTTHEAFIKGVGELERVVRPAAGELGKLRTHLQTIAAECRKGEELVTSHRRFVHSKMDVTDRFLRYYKKLEQIQQRIEGNKFSMDFLRLAFRPVQGMIEQSLALQNPTNEREAIGQDLTRAELFFKEIGRRTALILDQVEETLQALELRL
ncbi:motility associated factor glycosyltransferase family protein [Heliobacterium chlorum]|uniref:Motility associated factor glycosyltransferase family protein n=1 Tax=Heliobacterium chlorum TaxID=2698 RepID=A0ABR7T3M5_HELCL|nr:6-hydroxymethylpterin diphosphokinase MptE-like protein [Heliobacterium chlorum]MBC9784449.1 motility associated factor glycosyltransferase family protein [Heliobacterium chlorum]